MTNAYKDPTQEVLFDLTWIYVNWHEKQSRETQETLMDYFGGSRGVFERLHEEATEFNKANEATDWSGTDYYEAVDAWGDQMIHNLMALMAKAKVAGVQP